MKAHYTRDMALCVPGGSETLDSFLQPMRQLPDAMMIVICGAERLLDQEEAFAQAAEVLAGKIVYFISIDPLLQARAAQYGWQAYSSAGALADDLQIRSKEAATRRAARLDTRPLSAPSLPQPHAPKWKMFLITVPLAYAVGSGLGYPLLIWFPHLPFLIANMLVTVPLVFILTYVALPLATRLLHAWLHPHTSSPSTRSRTTERLASSHFCFSWKGMVLAIMVLLTMLPITAFFLFQERGGKSTLPASTPLPVIGHLQFFSSEQLSENSSQGISDQVAIDLNNLPTPVPNKSYYAWLLGDKNQSDTRTLLLGVLPVNNGSAHLLYPGDAAHTNLLLMTSRFLVTEEDGSVTPVSPSPDLGTWRDVGEFAQTPMNAPSSTAHYSYLDHLRHLLASDPALDEMELPGGLNTWFYRNTGKIVEWTGSMREQWEDSKDVGFVRRQTVRVLAYLDGLSFVRADVPPNTGLGINERLARVELLEVSGPNQNPPCYLTHIGNHLNGLLQASGDDLVLRKAEAGITNAMSNVGSWLLQVRRDAQHMMEMTDQQLRQPTTLTLINDMIDNANHASVGGIDPNTGEMREGVTWIHEQMQLLSTMDITVFAK